MTVTQHDLEILAEQLGRPPRGVRAIERYCSTGHPQVIRVYPLMDGRPFPTLFWLSCPALVLQISRLEHQGVIEKLEQMIESSLRFRFSYHDDHRVYIEERWAELSQRDQRWVEREGLTSVFRERGIGGLQDWDKVKCLHMQYAHHQARENVIGRWMDEHFTIRPCK